MQGIGCTGIGTAKVAAVVVGSGGLELRFDLGQLLVEPCVEFGTILISGQLEVEVDLEGGSVEQIQELPVVECAEEAHLGHDVVVHLACLLIDKLVEERDVESQTLPSPVHAGRAGRPGDIGEGGDILIVLPSPDALVGAELLQVEY